MTILLDFFRRLTPQALFISVVFIAMLGSYKLGESHRIEDEITAEQGRIALAVFIKTWPKFAKLNALISFKYYDDAYQLWMNDLRFNITTAASDLRQSEYIMEDGTDVETARTIISMSRSINNVTHN